MNAQRRKSRDRAIELLNDAIALLEEIKDEEDAAYENMPESLQECERGERLQENVDALQEIVDTLEDMVDNLTDVD